MNDIFDLGLNHQRPKTPLYRRPLRLIAVAASLAVFVAIGFVGVAVAGKYLRPSPPTDYVGAGTGTVTIDVAQGDSLTKIAQTLVAKGVVKSVSAFTDAAQYSSKAQDIQPGTYRLKEHMAGASALTLLLDPNSLVSVRLVVPEGTQLAKLQTLITSDTQIPAAEVERALARPDLLGLPAYANGKPEGFLFPATYNIGSTTTAPMLLSQMVKRYNEEAAQLELEADAKKINLSPYQVVIIASLLQAEVKSGDYPQAAEVIENRLRKGMKLQLDSTVNYALHSSKQFLSQSDLTVQSPYNTYLHTGLPPTPINSPGADALHAALHPPTGDLLYFVTVDPATGKTVFTNSESEFEKLRQQAQSAAASGPASGAASGAAGGSAGGSAAP